jgi:hypothetical protein
MKLFEGHIANVRIVIINLDPMEGAFAKLPGG